MPERLDESAVDFLGEKLPVCNPLVPVLDGFSFLSQAEKIQIMNGNPKKVFPAMAKWDAPVKEAVTAS